MDLLGNLARLSAILAGLLMTFITLLTCGSIIGRETIGQTIAGDFDNDGDQDSTDEYLLNRRKKISENIKKKDMSYCVCSGPNKTRGFTCSQHCKHGRK